MKIQINGADFAMVQRAVANKHDSRACLRFVLLDTTASQAVSANGHIMVEAPFTVLPDLSSPDTPPEPTLVRLDRVIPRSWEKEDIIIDTAEKTVRGLIEFGSPLPLLVQDDGVYPEASSFPRYQQVSASGPNFTPTRNKGPDSISFDPSILQAVTQKRQVRFTFQENASSAIRVDVGESAAKITFATCRWKDS